MKILVTGDLHIDNRTPSSRKDDFQETVMDKLSQIDEIAIDNNVDIIITPGDVFNQKSVSLQFVIRFMRDRVSRRSIKIPWYAIAGNHDVYYGREDSLSRTPLGLLFAAGVFKELRKGDVIRIGDCDIQGFHYDRDAKISNIESDRFKVAVIHKFLEKQKFGSDDVVDPSTMEGYNLVIAGHDHRNFKPVKQGNTVFVRVGALTRGTSSQSDMTREIQVVIVGIDNNQVSSYTEVPLKTKTAKQIYREEALEDKNDRKMLKSLIESLTKRSVVSGNISSMLRELCKNDQVFNTCMNYLQKYHCLEEA